MSFQKIKKEEVEFLFDDYWDIIVKKYEHNLDEKFVKFFLLECNSGVVSRYVMKFSGVYSIEFTERKKKVTKWNYTEISYVNFFYENESGFYQADISFWEDDYKMKIFFYKFEIKKLENLKMGGKLFLFSDRDEGDIEEGDLISSILNDIPDEGPWLNEEQVRREKPQHFET